MERREEEGATKKERARSRRNSDREDRGPASHTLEKKKHRGCADGRNRHKETSPRWQVAY